jgi:hypothetical protein
MTTKISMQAKNLELQENAMIKGQFWGQNSGDSI